MKLNIPAAILTLLASVTCSAATFTFEADASGQTTPFTDMNSGLSATFGGQASVCDSGGLFSALTGKVLIQSFCAGSQSGALSIGFSFDLSSVGFNFATAGGIGTLSLAAFENATPVGTANFSSVIPTGFFNGEGIANFAGIFNRVTLTSSNLLAIDNVNAVVRTAASPEPASFAINLCALAILVLMRSRFSSHQGRLTIGVSK